MPPPASYGRLHQRDLREHKAGQGDGIDGQLRHLRRLLSGRRATDPQAPVEHRRQHQEGQVAAGPAPDRAGV